MLSVEAVGLWTLLKNCLVVQSRFFVAMAGEATVPERQASPSTTSTWLRHQVCRSTSLLYLRFVLLQLVEG